MSDRARTCPIGACTDGKRPGDLFCLRHWRLVPRPLQRAIYRTYRDGPVREYLTAIETAASIAQRGAEEHDA